MKKLIEIEGNTKEEGTCANELNVLAAKKGKNLTEYIKELLKKHVEDSKK